MQPAKVDRDAVRMNREHEHPIQLAGCMICQKVSNIMKIIGSQRRETIFEAGYSVAKVKSDNELILQEKETGKMELWAKNDHHAGYTVEFKGIGYEFIRSL